MSKNIPTDKAGMYIPDVKGSWWNRGFHHPHSLAPGKYTPVRVLDVPGNSYVTAKITNRIDTLPAVSPLYGSWRLVTKVHFYPYRLGMPALRKNMRLNPSQSFDNELLPQFIFDVNLPLTYGSGSASQVNNVSTFLSANFGGIFERLGMVPFEMLDGQTFNSRIYPKLPNSITSATLPAVNAQFMVNAAPFWAYLHSWLWSEFNKQDLNIPVDDVAYYYSANNPDSVDVVGGVSIVDALKLEKLVNDLAFGIYSSSDDNNHVAGLDSQGKMLFTNGMFGSGFDDVYRHCLVENYPLFARNIMTATGVGSNLVRWDVGTNDNVSARWSTIRSRLNSVGLLPVTYDGDKFTSWFNEDAVNLVRSRGVLTSGMTFEELRLKHSNYLIAALEMISGDRYVDMLRYVYDEYLELKDHPILVGRNVLGFGLKEVLNQSANTDTSLGSDADVTQSLGYSGSRAHDGGSGKPIHFKAKEPGLLLITNALIPSVVYYQGLDRMFYKQYFGDLWHPQFQSVGFQHVMRGEMYQSLIGKPRSGYAFYDGNTSGYDDDRLGLQNVPYGWEYMTTESRVGGALGLDAFRTWTNARDFTRFVPSSWIVGEGVGGFGVPESLNAPAAEALVSTYVDRNTYDVNFVDNSPEAQNFIVDTFVDLSIYQPMSKQLLSNRL